MSKNISATKRDKKNSATADYVEISISPSVAVVAIVLILSIVGLIVWSVKRTDNAKATKTITATNNQNTKSDEKVFGTVAVENAPVLGKKDAPVTIIEFSDLECPYCRAFYEGIENRIVPAWPEIKKKYIDTGKVRYAVRTFVAVPSHNPAAKVEARATACANNQGKFFEYFDKLFEGTGRSGGGFNGKASGGEKTLVNELVSLAGKVGLDTNKFKACINSKDSTKSYDNDNAAITKMLDGMKNDPDFNGAGTPLFVICKTPKDNDTKCTGEVLMGAYPFSEFAKIIDPLLAQ